jgi:ATP-binding cassette subfamily F protein 3
MLLRLEGVSRSFGARTLFRDVSLGVRPGDRIGLVGANGVGKTTLLRILAGDEPPDDGTVSVPRDVRVALLRQEIDPGRGATVREETRTALAELDALEREIRELEGEMARAGERGDEVSADLAARYDRCRARFEGGGGFERHARVERVLEGLGFDGEARERVLRTLSGGWLMRVELAKLLLARPDVMLLDEPNNHLDLPSMEWFEETLSEYAGALVVISHDRAFLRRHALRIAELERGALRVYEGGWDAYLEQKALRREQLEAQKRSQDRRLAQTERFIERFRYKNTKARQVQSRIKALEKEERIELEPQSRSGMRLRIPPPRRAGQVVLRLEGICKSYGDTVVYRGVDLRVQRGDRVALVGPNGSGKSTLLRIAAGVLPCDGGERRTGHNVDVAFFAQHQLEALDAERSVLGELESLAQTDDIPRLRGHLGAFLFSGDDVKKKVSVLSGGEKARLALAKLLLRPANFLVLDEPTNHLDVAAREVLEAALADYAGTLLFISHDRAFIDALATRVVEVRGGTLTEHLGNYADYLRASAAREPGREAPVQATPARDKQARIAARQDARRRARDLARARRRLAELEREIGGLEERVEELGWRLGDPALHRDGEAVRALEAERGEVRQTLGTLYADWERVAGELEDAEAESA